MRICPTPQAFETTHKVKINPLQAGPSSESNSPEEIREREDIMKKEDIIKKLASRKFWVTLAGFIGSLLVAFNVGDNDIAQITAIITAFGSLMVYVLSESAVDAAAASANQTVTETRTEKNTSTHTALSKDLNAEVK